MDAYNSADLPRYMADAWLSGSIESPETKGSKTKSSKVKSFGAVTPVGGNLMLSLLSSGDQSTAQLRQFDTSVASWLLILLFFLCYKLLPQKGSLVVLGLFIPPIIYSESLYGEEGGLQHLSALFGISALCLFYHLCSGYKLAGSQQSESSALEASSENAETPSGSENSTLTTWLVVAIAFLTTCSIFIDIPFGLTTLAAILILRWQFRAQLQTSLLSTGLAITLGIVAAARLVYFIDETASISAFFHWFSTPFSENLWGKVHVFAGRIRTLAEEAWGNVFNASTILLVPFLLSCFYAITSKTNDSTVTILRSILYVGILGVLLGAWYPHSTANTLSCTICIFALCLYGSDRLIKLVIDKKASGAGMLIVAAVTVPVFDYASLSEFSSKMFSKRKSFLSLDSVLHNRSTPKSLRTEEVLDFSLSRRVFPLAAMSRTNNNQALLRIDLIEAESYSGHFGRKFIARRKFAHGRRIVGRTFGSKPYHYLDYKIYTPHPLSNLTLILRYSSRIKNSMTLSINGVIFSKINFTATRTFRNFENAVIQIPSLPSGESVLRLHSPKGLINLDFLCFVESIDPKEAGVFLDKLKGRAPGV